MATFVTPPVSNADTVSTPTFNLDGANTNSLAATSPTSWKDLVTNSATLTLGSDTTRSSDGGGSIVVSAGVQNGATSGAYRGYDAIGSASNPSGDMTLMIWIKPTSWNADWNIFASRWFSTLAGGGAGSDLDYHFSIKSPTSGGAIHKLNLYTTSKSDIYGTYDFALNAWYLVGFTLTSGGNLQFYVNGQPDGSVITGSAHTASATNYLFVGDYRNRSNCWACSLNGNIGKFRLWNSVLTSSQVAADYRNEAAAFGYSTTTTLSLSANNPKYRTTNTITATVPRSGRISFYERGKLIKGCKNVVVASTTATCSWKPSSHGRVALSANYTPTSTDYLSSSATSNLIVDVRTASR